MFVRFLRRSRKPAGTPVMESCCDVEQQILAALLGFAGIPEASEHDAGCATSSS